ncbi:FAD-dependent oxidoreductase [Paenibacillus allorhizosphaerae]|nr:FAD-dependent oxidoreductase [Paenibacillus allorhizosphaerae]
MKNRWWMMLIAGLAAVGLSSLGTVYGMTARDSDGSFLLRNPLNRNVDVVIIGTELEGMHLARRAKQEGLGVLILEPKQRLGGQLIQGEMQYLDGVYNEKGESIVQGGMKELFEQYEAGNIRKKTQFASYFHRLIHGIPIEKGIALDGVAETDGTVRSIRYTKDGKSHEVHPTYVVDNSDDAALLRKLFLEPLPGLGALYRGERKVGDSAAAAPQPEFMSATYMMRFKNVDWQRLYSHFWKLDKMERASLYGPDTYVDGNIAYGFPPIVGRYRLSNPQMLNLRGLNIVNQGDGEVLINALQVYGVDPSKPETIERGKQAARDEMPGILEHLRQHLTGFERAELNGEAQELYIREFYHYPAAYVLQATDLMSGRMFWDNVSIGGYFMDIQGSPSNREGLAVGKPDQYGMPLRSYLAKGYNNVVMAGKLVGSSVVAYGSTRIQANGVLAAESIGVLMGRMNGRSLTSVTEREMADFHGYMDKKYRIRIAPKEAKNKIAHLNEQEKEELNAGKLTLLGGNVVAKHLPFMKVHVGGTALRYTGGLKPLVIEGQPWAPLLETFHLLGAVQVRYDVDTKQIRYAYKEAPQTEHSAQVPVHVLNNFALIGLEDAAKLLEYRLLWDPERVEARLERQQLEP